MFKAVGERLQQIKDAKGIVGPIPYELQEDETPVPGASEYNQHLDSVVGWCGPKLGPTGEPHMCDAKCCVSLSRDTAYEDLMHAHDTMQLAGYLRMMMVVPQHVDLPALAVMAHPTCNSFTARWVRAQWEETQELATKYISPGFGDLQGRGSDGDERRHKEQKADMAHLPSTVLTNLDNIHLQEGECMRFGLCTPGFTMSGTIDKDGVVKHVHAQDMLHNLGKLSGHLDSGVRVLHLGPARLATQEHIRNAFDLFEYSELGLSYSHVTRQDPMDKEGAARCCSLKVQSCLLQMAHGFTDKQGKKHPPQSSVLGTVEYLRAMSRYMVIFFGRKASLVERVEHAAYRERWGAARVLG